MGNNPVIRFPSQTADVAADARVDNHIPEPQRRVIRQPVPLPRHRSPQPPLQTDRASTEPGLNRTPSGSDTPWSHATSGRITGQPCRRIARPATRGAFELDVSADFYATKPADLPPALFGYWLPRNGPITSARRRTSPPTGLEVLGYEDPTKPQPPSVLGYWPFHRPRPMEG